MSMKHYGDLEMLYSCHKVHCGARNNLKFTMRLWLAMYCSVPHLGFADVNCEPVPHTSHRALSSSLTHIWVTHCGQDVATLKCQKCVMQQFVMFSCLVAQPKVQWLLSMCGIDLMEDCPIHGDSINARLRQVAHELDASGLENQRHRTCSKENW